MTEFQILSAIKNNDGSIEYTALLNLNMTDTKRDTLADKERIKKMISKGLLKGKADAFCQITITNRGRLHLQNAYYLEEQKQKFAKDNAKNEAKKNRHDWWLAIGGAFVAGLIGLAFELVVFFFLK